MLIPPDSQMQRLWKILNKYVIFTVFSLKQIVCNWLSARARQDVEIRKNFAIIDSAQA